MTSTAQIVQEETARKILCQVFPVEAFEEVTPQWQCRRHYRYGREGHFELGNKELQR